MFELDTELKLRLLGGALLVEEDSNAGVGSGSLNLLCEQVQLIEVAGFLKVFKAFAPLTLLVNKAVRGLIGLLCRPIVVVLNVSKLPAKGYVLRFNGLSLACGASTELSVVLK